MTGAGPAEGPSFKPLAREPVYLKVHRAIEAEILSGRLPEGALLPTEGALCAQFGVTRSSVREGIRSLEQAGLITRGAAKRLVVTRPQADDVAAAASRGLALGGATFAEAWEALATFYPPAAGLAAQALTGEGIAALRRVCDRLEARSPQDADGVVADAVAFFQSLAARLENRVMLALLQSLNLLIDASLRHVIRQTPRARSRIVEAQRALIAALEARDESEARAWMAKHIDDLKRGYAVAGVDLSEPVSVAASVETPGETSGANPGATFRR